MVISALAQKGKIGSVEIKNRIVVAAINNNFAHNAFMSDESVDFYVSKARGGAGLVIVEATSVDYPRSRSVLNPAIDDDKYLPAFKRIADGCHQYGAKVMVQISHVGRQTTRKTTGMDPIAPSALAGNSPLYPDTPKVLDVEGIRELVVLFGNAALRTQKAGCDGVELILGHGYLMNNFLSPLSNLRTDEYAGIAGGVRFCKEIICEIKKRCGKEYPVICRLNGDDYVKEKGNTPVETQLISQQLELAGADAINVSAGMRDSELSFNDHTSGMPRGSWIHLAERIKRGVAIPVIVVKRFSPELAEETLAAGKADFVAWGKQFIADSDFANKVLNERNEDIIPCTSCCQGCYDQLWMKVPITCMVNPAVGRAVASVKAHNDKKGDKTVLVIGGGPAGCEAALEAARAGNKVTLIEKEAALGGNYGFAAFTQAKKEVADVFRYLATAMRKARVDVRLGTAFTPDLLRDLKPQVVIDATGADFIETKIKGADMPHVLDPKQAIDGTREVGRYVVVVACNFGCTWTCRKVSRPIPDDVVGMQTLESYACSAGHAAADVAEELAMRGKKVAVITGRDSFVPGMGFTNRGNMFKRFFPKNITVSNNVKVKEIVSGALLCEKDGMEFKVCADTVVMSTGMQPRNGIAEALKGFDGTVLRVGDCQKIGNALKAFCGGYEIVEQI